MENIELSDNDVVSMASHKNFTKTSTSKVSEINTAFLSNWLAGDYLNWARGGIDCEVLFESGSGWHKGKIKLRMEFIPDKPVEPSSCDAVLGGQN